MIHPALHRQCVLYLMPTPKAQYLLQLRAYFGRWVTVETIQLGGSLRSLIVTKLSNWINSPFLFNIEASRWSSGSLRLVLPTNDLVLLPSIIKFPKREPLNPNCMVWVMSTTFTPKLLALSRLMEILISGLLNFKSNQQKQTCHSRPPLDINSAKFCAASQCQRLE